MPTTPSTPEPELPLGIKTRREQLPRADIFYDVPFHPQSEKSNTIPKEYVKARMDYAVDSLSKRLEVAMGKHLSAKRDDVRANIRQLGEDLRSVVDSIGEEGITSKSQLDAICAQVKAAVLRFKGDRQRNLDVGQKVADLLHQTEKKALAALFDVSQKPEEIGGTGINIGAEELKEALDEMDGLIAKAEPAKSLLPDARKDRKSIDGTVATIHSEFWGVEATLEKFPTDASFPELPDTLVNAVLEIYKKYNQAFDNLRAFRTKYAGIVDQDLPTEEDLRRLQGIIDLFETLARLRPALRSQPDYKRLQELKNKFADAANLLRESRNLKAVFETVASSPEIFRLAMQVGAFFLPQGEDLKNTLDSIFKVSPATIAIEDELPKVEVEGGEAPKMARLYPSFQWKSAPEEEARAEALKRLREGLPLFDYLYSNQRWTDLSIIMNRFTYQELYKTGVTRAYFGGEDSRYKSREDMWRALLPAEVFTAAENPSKKEEADLGKRFRWVGKSKPEIYAEVKRRIFEGWPLVQDLVQQNNFAALRQLFDKWQSYDDDRCRLTAVAGSSASMYPKVEDLLREAFSEVFDQKA